MAWAAYPDTVLAGESFPLEFAGPVAPDACGRLDTAVVAVTDSSIVLSARRSTYDTMCPDTPVGFYEVRSMRLQVGAYDVRAGSRSLGRIVALDSGSFSSMFSTGRGTVREAGGCLVFGPGRLGNQRPFVLLGAPAALEAWTDTDRLVQVSGRFWGFRTCGNFGSRPAIRVDSARVLTETADSYYE